MVKIKAFLATAKQFLFDKTFPDIEEAFKINAETDINQCEGYFGSNSKNEIEQKIAKRAIRAALLRGLKSYACTIKNYLKGNK